MFEKSPISVLILSMVTFGIYGIIWLYKTSEEMQQRGIELPSFIFVFIPILNFLYAWKYYQGVERLSNGEHTATMLFLFSLLGPLSLVSFWQTQTTFNKVAAAG
ncbi:hypothetical protein ENSA5_47240 [Enhygromyxa salina]|uniref:DUF4234 domain-containing protein n=2 Tax=Enhygromyxa salina TaxID=215803 RepID=A0A2S9XJF1_9BACT|nr:hypothetical protein ENSA5_47240 [Enhygromyxa salina]